MNGTGSPNLEVCDCKNKTNTFSGNGHFDVKECNQRCLETDYPGHELCLPPLNYWEHEALEAHVAQYSAHQALTPSLDSNVLALPNKLPGQAGSTNLQSLSSPG